jgi:hypothetical protein
MIAPMRIRHDAIAIQPDRKPFDPDPGTSSVHDELLLNGLSSQCPAVVKG